MVSKIVLSHGMDSTVVAIFNSGHVESVSPEYFELRSRVKC